MTSDEVVDEIIERARRGEWVQISHDQGASAQRGWRVQSFERPPYRLIVPGYDIDLGWIDGARRALCYLERFRLQCELPSCPNKAAGRELSETIKRVVRERRMWDNINRPAPEKGEKPCL